MQKEINKHGSRGSRLSVLNG